MTQGMSFSSFTGHKTSAGRASYLKDWKDRKTHSVTVWLHTAAPIYALWQHNFNRLVNWERDGQKSWEVWGDRLNCWEDEETLKGQFRRDKNTNERKHPPKVCGFCKLQEWLYQQVAEGDLSWVEPVFEFEGDDPKKTFVYHAGGMIGLFGQDDLSKEDKAELHAERISIRESYREVTRAKCSYLFTVVENDAPSQGILIAKETSLLGDKVKQLFKHRAESVKDKALADYSKHPYAIKWLYDPDDSIEFGKKYDAVRMEDEELTDEIRKLIVESDPPDVTFDVAKFNPADLRARMEKHALIDMPWDDFFGDMPEQPASERADARPSRDEVRGPKEDKKEPPKEEPKRPPKEEPKAPREPVRGKQEEKAAPPSISEDDPEAVACDACEKVISIHDNKCAHCGHVYVAEPPPEKPKPALRKRSEVAKASPKEEKPAEKPADKPSPKRAPPGPMRKGGAFDRLPDDKDDLPF